MNQLIKANPKSARAFLYHARYMQRHQMRDEMTASVKKALALSPDTISTSCPYCLVMLGDAVAAKKANGEAKDTLEVVDVAQLLARSVTPVKQEQGTADG